MTEQQEELLYQEEDTQKDKYLTFMVGKEVYGIEIKLVTEIIGIQSITGVPEQPDYVKGIINLRGKIIPVIDVRIRFKKEAIPYNDRTCIVVIQIRDLAIGLIVDSVAEVSDLPESDVVPPPQVNKESQNKYIKGIGKVNNDVRLILDCEKLLSDEEIESLSETQEC